MKPIIRLLFLSFIPILLNSQTCFSLIYPRLFGDSLGDSEYSAMDIDTSGNIAIGGTSYSTNIASGTGSPNPFVVFFNSNGS